MSGWTSLRKTAYLLLPLLIYLVVHDVLQILLLAATEMLLENNGLAAAFIEEHAATAQGLINGLSILGGVGILWQAVRSEVGEKIKPVQQTMKQYILLAVLSFCFSVGLNIVFYQTGFSGRSESYEAVYELQYGVQFIIGVILYGLVSPFAEEVIFRGLLFQRMKRCFNYGIALIFSSLLFGLYHGNVVQAVYGTVLGIVIAWSFELTGNFMAPVLFHAVANISVYTMTYGNRLTKMGRESAVTIAIILLATGIFVIFWLQKKKNQD